MHVSWYLHTSDLGQATIVMTFNLRYDQKHMIILRCFFVVCSSLYEMYNVNSVGECLETVINDTGRPC